MELNGPGISLFQGNDLSNFDNISQREEEDEAIEEQRKRDLELRNMLENAFDDVSFENDDGSVCSISQNQSNTSHSTFQANYNPDFNVFKVSQNNPSDEFENSDTNNFKNFNTPSKHTAKNYSDQCRKKIQSGSLQDVVDASGGGGDGDVQPSLHYKHCLNRNSVGEVICNGVSEKNNKTQEFIEDAYDSSEQLRILYDVRVREVHRLTELIDSMRNEHELEIKDLKHQISLLLAERERANISQAQLQNLLVSSKQEAEELKNKIDALNQTNKELDTHNRELDLDLDTAKLTIDSLERKLLVLEKGSKDKTESMQYELNIKALTEKHNHELLNLRKELNNYIKHCETLEKQNEELKLKVSNLHKINDENLASKSEIISRLSKQIDENQREHESLSKGLTTEDKIRLQTELKILREEKSDLLLKLENMEKENTKLEEELKQFDSLDKLSCFSGSSFDAKSVDVSDMFGKLRVELYRSLNGQKLRRQEIKDLEIQLNEKNEQITRLTENESILKSEVEKLKEEIEKYMNEIKKQNELILSTESNNKKLQNHIKELEQLGENTDLNLQNKCEHLEKENEFLKIKIHGLEKDKNEIMNTYNEEYMRFHNSELDKVREETEKQFKLEELKKNLEIENLQKEIEELKNLYVEVYNSKENLLAQIDKEKNSTRSSIVDVEEVKRLQKELERSRQRILELDQTLKQQYQQEVEILNIDINQLKLQMEKIKKEKDREVAEKDKILVENELLKTEIEEVTSEKNLCFFKCEKLEKEIQDLHKENQKTKENFKDQIKELVEKHESDLQHLVNKYEIKTKKLKKEIELTLLKNVKYESKSTSPMKGSFNEMRDMGTQRSPVPLKCQSTSPIQVFSKKEVSTSPISVPEKSSNKRIKSLSKQSLSLRDISVLTDPEPQKISKKEVIQIMEKLGLEHENEMKALENKYHMELMKFDKKFQIEVDKAKEIIRRELKKEHLAAIEQLEEKHRIELENRIETERKEAVVDLITEWACEVQSLKVACAEAQAEMEKTKMKYKAAKSVALQYKMYFKSKAEHMKEEWKRIEDGYERALKELEKNVNFLVDVKEDEVKAKVESITKIYEQKINKMKDKLSKCEDKLKAERCSGSKSTDPCKFQEKGELKRDLERLVVPDGNLLHEKHCFTDAKKTKSKDMLNQHEKLNDHKTQKSKLKDFEFPLRKTDMEKVIKSDVQKNAQLKEKLYLREKLRGDREKNDR